MSIDISEVHLENDRRLSFNFDESFKCSFPFTLRYYEHPSEVKEMFLYHIEK